MKIIKNIIGFVVAIAVMPAIILTVKDVTELKGVRDVQFELLSEEENEFIITTGTYIKLIENKNIINYDIESNYPLITREEMERVTWKINDELKNEIYIDENGQKRISENVGRVTFNGTEEWIIGRAESGWATDGDTVPFYIFYNDLSLNNVNYNGKTLNNLNNEVFDADQTLIFNDIEGFSFSGFNYAILRINKNRLDTPDVDGLRQYLLQLTTSGNPLTVYYEILDKSTRPVEVYDFSTFKLAFDDNRIRVLFDIDEGYYLWEITDNDRLIPINGQYDLGGIWTVKFYVYKIQQPLIRSLILLIPLIMISGLLFYLFKLLKIKD